MAKRFEQLTREMAEAVPRRRILTFMGAGAAAAVGAALVRPLRADAACGAGETPCGAACCPKDFFCGAAGTNTFCCCPKGSTPCGASCCAKGVACLDAGRGICGCQAGTTPCGDAASLTCCPAGTACTAGCPGPSGNVVKGLCAPSDARIKDNVIPVTWERP